MKNQHFNPDEIWESIELPDNLDLLIKDSVEEGYKRMSNKKKKAKNFTAGKAAAAVAILALGCAAAIPVSAIVNSFVQERMEQVPAEEIKEVESVMDEQQVNADSFSREYTDSEKERYGILYRAYMQGTFPEGELKQEPAKTDGAGDSLYYAQDTSTFYLPERELTDEELLEIIEFNAKRDYALAQRAEPEEMSPEEKQVREQIAETGGITEEKAIELGTDWLHRLYGISEQGMELNYYLDKESVKEGGAYYNVNFSVQSVEYYYFELDAQNGTLLNAYSSLAADFDEKAVGVSALEEKKEALCKKAEEVLTGPLQKNFEYERLVMVYHDKNGYLDGINRVSFFFLAKDQSACEIVMNAEREAFLDYRYIENYAEYEQGQQERRERSSKGAESKAVYVELDPQLK